MSKRQYDKIKKGDFLKIKIAHTYENGYYKDYSESYYEVLVNKANQIECFNCKSKREKLIYYKNEKDSRMIIVEISKQTTLKTSEEWSNYCPFTVLAPDGWDRKNYQYSWFEERITKMEFDIGEPQHTARASPS